MPRSININPLLSALDSLRQRNEREKARKEREDARKRAQAASQLRTLGTIGGAIVGGSVAGPTGAGFGAQAGSTLAGLFSASQGNEEFPTQEVASTGVSAIAFGNSLKKTPVSYKIIPQKIEGTDKQVLYRQGYNSENQPVGQPQIVPSSSIIKPDVKQAVRYEFKTENIEGQPDNTITYKQGYDAGGNPVGSPQVVPAGSISKPKNPSVYQTIEDVSFDVLPSGQVSEVIKSENLDAEGNILKTSRKKRLLPGKWQTPVKAQYGDKIVTATFNPTINKWKVDDQLVDASAVRKFEEPDSNQGWGTAKAVLYQPKNAEKPSLVFASYNKNTGDWRSNDSILEKGSVKPIPQKQFTQLTFDEQGNPVYKEDPQAQQKETEKIQYDVSKDIRDRRDRITRNLTTTKVTGEKLLPTDLAVNAKLRYELSLMKKSLSGEQKKIVDEQFNEIDLKVKEDTTKEIISSLKSKNPTLKDTEENIKSIEENGFPNKDVDKDQLLLALYRLRDYQRVTEEKAQNIDSAGLLLNFLKNNNRGQVVQNFNQ